MNDVCLFIKTYKKDFVWLEYCLKSIKKYCTGYADIVIVVPKTQMQLLGKYLQGGERVIGVEEYGEGYLYQQMVKMNAHNYTKCQYIQYFDSDCVFHTPNNPSMYFENGTPWMLMTPYGEGMGAGNMWQSVVENAIGIKPEFEFMRRHGLIYHRSTLENIQRDFPQMNDYVMTRPSRHFSEFNVMGAYAYYKESGKYIWKNTETTPFIHGTFNQFWSYSGCTDEEKQKMEDYLK